MNQAIDLSEYKRCKIKFFENYPQWALYLKEIKKSKNSYLLYKEDSKTRTDIFLNTKYYALKWEMPSRFETEKRRFHFTDHKLNLGIFRFPLNVQGEKTDVYLSDPGKLMEVNEEDVMELIDSEIISFDVNKIDIIYFELDEISEEELVRVEKYWQSKGFLGAKEEINNLRKFMIQNYQNCLTNAFQKISSYPNYLGLLTDVLDKKISSVEVKNLTNGIISNIVI